MSAFFAQHAFWIVTILKIIVLLFVILTLDAYLTWFERKVVAHIQSRWGPYRVGPHGLLQPLADGLKFLFKEDPTPAGVDKFVYYLAPFLALSLALTSLAVIPFGPDPIRIFGYETNFGVADLNIGLLILYAITALGVYGVALAGWSSNSKYPLLGGLRSSAQMMSYELALTLSVVGVLLMANSFNLRDIIAAQGRHPKLGLLGWNIFPQILGFFRRFSAFSVFLSPRWQRRIALRSICRKPNRSSSPVFTPNTRASSSPCFSSRNTQAWSRFPASAQFFFSAAGSLRSLPDRFGAGRISFQRYFSAPWVYI